MKLARLLAKACLVAVVLTMLLSTGCKSNSGSREFIPGKGWRPT